jgi:hypothetical protein
MFFQADFALFCNPTWRVHAPLDMTLTQRADQAHFTAIILPNQRLMN